MYDKTIAHTYYFEEFTNEESAILCHYSNKEMFEYHNEIKLRKHYINGLFYEVSQITGNWRRKDTILPKLFAELVELISDTVNIIEKYEKEELLDNYLIQSKYFTNKKRMFSLLLYLIHLIDQKFFSSKPLSDEYTHRSLAKEIKRMDKRIDKLLENYLEYTSEQCRDYAKEGLKNLIMEQLAYIDLPFLSTPHDIAKLFRTTTDYKSIITRIEKCFEPGVGNTEYSLGLVPIWEDIPGKGIAAYYFDYFEGETSDNKPFVLIVEKAKAPLLAEYDIPYYQSESPLLALFEKVGKKETFLTWFNYSAVKKNIARYLLWRIIYRYTENENKKELTEEDYKESTRIAKEKLSLLEKYYGITYSFEELTAIIKDYETGNIQNYNLKDEIKEKQIQIVRNLFPIIGIKEGGE